MKRFRSHLRYSILVGLPALMVAAAVVAAPKAEKYSYPYDPTCAWGRLADGRGMILRCLSETEAKVLAKARAAAEKKPEAEEPSGGGDAIDSRDIKVDVGPVTADKGKLGIGKLGSDNARSRYRQCLERHGGLKGDDAEVSVRFLVRERGRAEGVSVAKMRGMTKDAARCVAGVVDRRYVGLPSEPIVGATILIKFSH